MLKTAPEKSREITKPHNELVTGNGEVSKLIRQFFEKQATMESNQRGSAKRDSQPTRGKAPETSAKLALEAMHHIGETAYMELRTAARDFQEGHIPVKSFYARAYELCDGEMDILLRLATYLPDTARKEELLRFHDAATCLDI